MAVEIEELRQRVARLSDQQLLVMTTWQRTDYRPEALELADAELRRRGLLPTAPPPPNVPVAAVSYQDLDRGEDIISKGCLGIGLIIVLALTFDRWDGVGRWFWPGLWGWVFVPLILAGMFGAAGWVLKKLKRQP